MKQTKIYVGGQAVIEGVMMRGPEYIATAVRTPSGEITVKKDTVHSITERYPILKKPFLRGTVALCESLVYGMKSLSYSAQAAGEEDEQITNTEMALTMAFSIVLAIVFFLLIPTYAVKFIPGIEHSAVWMNIVEGVLRLAIFLLYIWGISLTKDIRRVFEYHGAEHKTIWTYESGQELTVENVRRHSRLHPRCGTNFLLIVMVVSIFVFAFLGVSGSVFQHLVVGEGVAGIHEYYPVSFCPAYAFVHSLIYSSVGFAAPICQILAVRLYDFRSTVGGASVDDYVLLAGIALLHDAFHCLFNLVSAVERHCHYAECWLIVCHFCRFSNLRILSFTEGLQLCAQ